MRAQILCVMLIVGDPDADPDARVFAGMPKSRAPRSHFTRSEAGVVVWAVPAILDLNRQAFQPIVGVEVAEARIDALER